jgi:hypothetical protein
LKNALAYYNSGVVVVNSKIVGLASVNGFYVSVQIDGEFSKKIFYDTKVQLIV